MKPMQGQTRKEEATAQDLSHVMDMLVHDGRRYNLDVNWTQRGDELELWIRMPLRDDSRITTISPPGLFAAGVALKYNVIYDPTSDELTVVFTNNGEKVYYWISNVHDAIIDVDVENGVAKVRAKSSNPEVTRSVSP